MARMLCLLLILLPLVAPALAQSAVDPSAFLASNDVSISAVEEHRYTSFQQCMISTEGNATLCLSLPKHTQVANLPTEVDDLETGVALDFDDFETMEDKWLHFMREMQSYATKATLYVKNVASHAYEWADLAEEWAFFGAKLHPYNAVLPSAEGAVDHYTDDVASYSAALASFSSGFGVVADETAEFSLEFETFVGAFVADPSGTSWSSGGKDLSLYSAHILDKVSYLATYAADHATNVGVWFDNVDYLAAQDKNVTSHSFPVLEKAEYLNIYAKDMADMTAEWAESAEATLKWAEDWVEYGERYA